MLCYIHVFEGFKIRVAFKDWHSHGVKHGWGGYIFAIPLSGDGGGEEVVLHKSTWLWHTMWTPKHKQAAVTARDGPHWVLIPKGWEAMQVLKSEYFEQM